MLKVAVVGCGRVAQKRHIPSFRRLKRRVSLCAVCDLNHGLAKEAAQEFGIPRAYSSFSEMLSKEDLDIVDICTPPQDHLCVALQAMEAGSYVLMEKPMALTVSDCDKMISASHKNGVKLCIVQNQRFYPPFLTANKLVDNGAIGELTGMRILSLTHRAEFMAHENHWVHKLPGGVIGETGPHAVYMSLAFLKNVRDIDVFAKKTLDYPWVLYDDYRIMLEGEGMNSSIIIRHAGDYTAEEVDLFGIKGTIKMDLQSMLLIHYEREDLTPMSLALSSLNVASQIVKGVMTNAFRVMFRRPMLGHDILVEKFVESIINDHEPPVTAEEGRETVRIMEMIVDKLYQRYGCSAHSSQTNKT